MRHYKLRRCAVCRTWDAFFLVQDSEGKKRYFCYPCWRKLVAEQEIKAGPETPGQTDEEPCPGTPPGSVDPVG